MTAIVASALATAAERLGADATAVLARLTGPLGEAARESLRELAALDEGARKQRRIEHALHARHPRGPLHAMHPTWIEAALAKLPARARTAIASSSSDPVDVWLARWATAWFPFMPSPPRRDIESIVAREPAQILAWLTAIGSDQIAHALDRPTRMPIAQLGPRRAAIARCEGVQSDAPAVLLVASRALATHLATDPIARLQLTRRIPYSEGITVEKELVAYAGTPLDQAPARATLFAY